MHDYRAMPALTLDAAWLSLPSVWPADGLGTLVTGPGLSTILMGICSNLLILLYIPVSHRTPVRVDSRTPGHQTQVGRGLRALVRLPDST